MGKLAGDGDDLYLKHLLYCGILINLDWQNAFQGLFIFESYQLLNKPLFINKKDDV